MDPTQAEPENQLVRLRPNLMISKDPLRAAVAAAARGQEASWLSLPMDASPYSRSFL